MFLKIASECLLPLATTGKLHCARPMMAFMGRELHVQ